MKLNHSRIPETQQRTGISNFINVMVVSHIEYLSFKAKIEGNLLKRKCNLT